MFKSVFNKLYPFWWTFDLFFHTTPSFAVIFSSTHLVTERGFILVTISRSISILSRMGACSMKPTIFHWFFFARFILGSGNGRVFLQKNSSKRYLISSNICNYIISFARMFSLATIATSGGSGVTVSLSFWFGGVLPVAHYNRYCTFFTSWRTWPAM